jgi:hypothetical protein
MGDTDPVNPLIWLALPVLITAVAAIVLLRRERASAPDDDEQLRRIEQALGRDD